MVKKKNTRAQTSVPRIHFQNFYKHQKTTLALKTKIQCFFFRKIQVIYRFYEKNKGYIGLTQNYRFC